jgi:type IV secretion system protein VirD4
VLRARSLWATARDLRRLRVKRASRGRVILGRYQRQLVASEPRTSVLVSAPTQSGKTTSLVIPAILEWDGPILATSIKADLVNDTHSARTMAGDVKVFDPTASTGLTTGVWSPITTSGTWSAARRTAAGILLIREKDAFGASVDDRHWKPAAARLLAPLLMAAAHSNRPIGQVLRWLARLEATGTIEEIAQILAHSRASGADVALDVLLGLQDRDSRYRSSVIATLETALDPWLEPSVAHATTRRGDISADWLFGGPNTLYLTAPAYDQHRLGGLFTALINTVVEEAFARCTLTGRPLDPPLLLCLDEAANVAPLPNLAEIAATGAGQGVQVLSVFQNLSQISERGPRPRRHPDRQPHSKTVRLRHRRPRHTGLPRRDPRRRRDPKDLYPPPTPPARARLTDLQQRLQTPRRARPHPPNPTQHRTPGLRKPATGLDQPASLVPRPHPPRTSQHTIP